MADVKPASGIPGPALLKEKVTKGKRAVDS